MDGDGVRRWRSVMTTLPSFFRPSASPWSRWQHRLRRAGLAFVAVASVVAGGALSLQIVRTDGAVNAPTGLILAVVALLVLPTVMWATSNK